MRGDYEKGTAIQTYITHDRAVGKHYVRVLGSNHPGLPAGTVLGEGATVQEAQLDTATRHPRAVSA